VVAEEAVLKNVNRKEKMTMKNLSFVDKNTICYALTIVISFSVCFSFYPGFSSQRI
jgi:hypothetical protein